jgi:branched-chain amino acid transport system permease protein
MSYLLIQISNGLIIGLIYALIAAGVTLVFSILKIVNFADGELYMLGGYFSYYAADLLGVPPVLALLVAMAASFAFGVIFERGFLGPLYSEATERKPEYGLIVTFGLSVFLRNIAVNIFGPFPLRPPSFWPGVQHIGGLIIENDRIVAGGIGLLLFAGLLYFMHRTAWGQALDAVSQSRESAAIVGINARFAFTAGFGLGQALAGAAGALVAPLFSLSPSMGILPGIQAYVIVILGGLGSVLGSIFGGLAIGLAETMFIAFFPDPMRSQSYSYAFGVFILMVVLFLKPTGFFGRRYVQTE